MSGQAKTFVAYIVGVSLLVLGSSLFKAWEPSLPLVRGVLMETPQAAGGLPRVARD